MATFSLAQAHQRFKILYDKVDSFNSPEFTPEEIDEFLNMAQDKLIAGVTARGIEASQELTDLIKNIVERYKTTGFTTSGINETNGYFVQLPANYYTALREELEIAYTKCGTLQSAVVPVYPTTRDRYNRVKHDPFNKPDLETVIRLAYSNTLNAGNLVTTFELIVDPSVTPVTYILDYVRRPALITYCTQYASPAVPDVNCELEDKAYYKIIDMAVDLALEAMRLKQPQQVKE